MRVYHKNDGSANGKKRINASVIQRKDKSAKEQIIKSTVKRIREEANGQIGNWGDLCIANWQGC